MSGGSLIVVERRSFYPVDPHNSRSEIPIRTICKL